ncbi:RnfH family protein [Paraferrimonas sedimenticola]|uniref:UPF0125 protein GCM10007895_03240 n=1 Tax=Paraferrimonas sedimenticola TaxID=375674 RepID=A0AA37RR03_9GAMM|nr:RnfH family protein [Paraferrimonas sedimenticola]GLP95018.1 UPF0125 protein [Paraferrimonas sedimenticola]
MATNIKVEVVYPLPHEQRIFKVELAEGATALDAIKASGIEEYYPEVDFASHKLGIFSRLIKPTEVLESGQRVEIYRPLIADPKDVRRQRAAKAVAEGRANATTGARKSSS